MKTFQSFDRNIRIRFLLTFFALINTAMVMPYTVVYFSTKIGPELTTIMIFIIGTVSLIGYIFGGIITDRFGRKKLIIISEILTGIGFIIVSYFDSIKNFFVLPILISFSIIYFFQSAANPAYSALLIDSSEGHDRKAMYTYLTWISNIAFALGILLGGFFFEHYSYILYFFVGATSFISAICTYFLIKDYYYEKLKDQMGKQQKKQTSEKKSFIQSNLRLFSVFFILLYLGGLLLSLLKEQLPNYLSVRFVSKYPISENIHLTGYNMISLLHLEDTLLTAFAAGIILKLTRKFSDKSNLLFGLMLFISGYVFLSYFIHPVLLLIGMLFIAVGKLIYNPTLSSIVANAVPEHSRGTVLSILGLMDALGGILSGLFIWGSKYLSETMITWIFICIGLVILFIYQKVYSKYERAEEKRDLNRDQIFKQNY
ncbi:MFS transporter [Fervidibacillus halotolerans]|uniref:MFS transporter n=1 Tax=Fervidibacillus halotolerans TaxID=2980027 RepID=A0A9E8LZ66_9BACI|nr:MFS transporter [Fervidibacillus halotolerans]WAA11975.1 MFS transporter [Fervidibacillus halotolerans]